MKYNNFKEIQETTIPKGGAIFEALGIVDDPDNPGRKMRCDEYLAPTTTIYKDAKSEDVAALLSVSPDDSPIFVPFIKFGRETRWRIYLKEGVPEDEATYKRLKWSDENIDRIGRNPHARAIYREYDPLKEERSQVDIERAIAKAMSLATALNEDQMKQFGVAAGMTGNTLAQIELYAFSVAKSNPDKFMEIYDKVIVISESKEPKDVFKRALKSGQLQQVKETRQILFDGQEVAVYTTPNPNFEILGNEIKSNFPEVYEQLR